MEIGVIVEHFMSGHRGRILAMADGLVHVLVEGLGVIEDRTDRFSMPEAA